MRVNISSKAGNNNMSAILKSAKGISTLSLLILLLASGVTGAVLSYLWTEGYYLDKGFRIPEDVTTITVTNATFPIQNSTYFNVTVLNPSYSKGDANITSIALVAISDDAETIYSIPSSLVTPSIPRILTRGNSVTFKCVTYWGEFAGQTIRVAVFLQGDSGATFPYKTNTVKLEISADINTEVTIERFNVTINNSPGSLIPLNVTRILFDSANIPYQNITIPDENATLPQELQPGQNKTFICSWNLWRKTALGKPHTITATTSQGYLAVYKIESLPSFVSLNITDIAANLSDTSKFNVTISNLPLSPHFVNISRVTVTNGTQVFNNVTIIGTIPRAFMPGENITLQCLWNWGAFKGQKVMITVYTTQGFYTYEFKEFPKEEA